MQDGSNSVATKDPYGSPADAGDGTEYVQRIERSSCATDDGEGSEHQGVQQDIEYYYDRREQAKEDGP